MYTKHCTQMCTNNKRLGGKRAYKVETRLYKVQCIVYLEKERDAYKVIDLYHCWFLIKTSKNTISDGNFCQTIIHKNVSNYYDTFFNLSIGTGPILLFGFCKRGTSMISSKIGIDWGSRSRRGSEGMHQNGLAAILCISVSIQ